MLHMKLQNEKNEIRMKGKKRKRMFTQAMRWQNLFNMIIKSVNIYTIPFLMFSS
ncbi:hypothetical protein HanIR_Chr11g0516881 [Helianthus annuus]|nr:hypothetical protein HanIR_Chr11g0516881 [Helianthus annuus]